MTADLLGLAGCVSVPMTPLVYGSKTAGGLDMSNGTANPSVSISLGYERGDFALVPVAVMERKGQAPTTHGKGGENVQIIRGDDRDTDTECKKPGIAEDATARAASDSQPAGRDLGANRPSI